MSEHYNDKVGPDSMPDPPFRLPEGLSGRVKLGGLSFNFGEDAEPDSMERLTQNQLEAMIDKKTLELNTLKRELKRRSKERS